MLQPTDRYEIDTDRATGTVIDGEAIVINLATGAYYSMLGPGADVWSLVSARQPAAIIIEQLTARYDVDRATVESHLGVVIGQMIAEGLVRAASAPADPLPAFSNDRNRAWEPPVLHAYRDMQDLLALDPPAPGLSAIPWKPETS